MNESIRKFLEFRIATRSLEEFTRNTATVTVFINELEALEADIASFDGLNKGKYDELTNKYSALLTKYNSLKEFFSKNQEIAGRIGVVQSELDRYSKVIDFGSSLGKLKTKVDELKNIDTIIREFNELKAVYERNSEIINKNDRVAEEYNIIVEKVNFIIANKSVLKEIISQINSLSVTDDNYESLLEKFDNYKAKLEEVFDEVLLPKVSEIVELLSLYPVELEKVLELQNKIQFVINRTNSDDWGKRRYLSDIKNLKTGFQNDYNNLSLTKKPFISSAACQACLEKINALQAIIEEIDKAIKDARKISDIYEEIRELDDVSEIDSKVNEAKNKYRAFKHKDRFPALATDVKDIEKNAKNMAQNIAVNAIKSIESRVFARNADTLTVNTLKGYKRKVSQNYDILDSEHKSKVHYVQITTRINSLIKRITFEDRHSPFEFLYILVFVVASAFLVGFYFYTKNVGYTPVKWLFNNPPFFGHKWAHWALNPWKWVQNVKVTDLFSFLWLILVFVFSVICMLVCLIGEVLWFILSYILFGISWVILTLLSIILHLLMYGFPGVVAFLAIGSAVGVKSENDVKSPTWMIVTIILVIGLVAVSYLNLFHVLKF